MDVAVMVIRWIGLLMALGLTLVVLKEVALVLRTLRDVRRLAERIRDAARALADRTAPAAELGALDLRRTGFDQAVRRLQEAVSALREQVGGAMIADRGEGR